VTQLRRYCLFDTALGAFGIAWSEAGLCRLQLPERDSARAERRLRVAGAGFEASEPTSAVAAAIAEIRRYLSGERAEFAGVPLDLSGIDPFHQEVYRTARRRVSWGKVTTYGELARLAGAQGEAREVGQALARNPIAIIIPCHRVLAKGLKIGGFSAYGGVLTKRRLLALEGVSLDEDAPLLRGLLP
jgi:methylated-DNA-[protein]-cysteine S-methyltransferase